ncbi:MAG: cupin domain-containing protein [Chloroflexia bacterium]|nr:cupin domain-containing protein [Chloroflexia bacterium]
MQRVVSVIATSRAFRLRVATPLIAGLLGASLLLAPAAYAQDATPAASPEASPVAEPVDEQEPATISELFSYELDEFPTAPVSVRLLRITLQPGASSPMHTHPGPEFGLVESGTLTVDSDGDADLVPAGEAPVTGPLTGETLAPGDLVVFPSGTGMNLVNNGEEDLVLLSAVFHPVSEDVPSTRYTDGDPEPGAFDGVSFQVLGDGIIQSFDDGSATITLEEIVAPAGTDLPDSSGAAMYSLIEGSFAFAVQAGDVQVSRTASPGLRPNAAPQQEFSLAAGDAAFFPAGVAPSPRTDQSADLSLLRLTAEPVAPFAAGLAEVAFLTSGEEPEASAQFTEIGIGAGVVSTTDSLNVRAEPSVAADGVDQVDEGVELLIVGGPEEADDFTWWEIAIVDSEGPVTGWVVVDFIALPGAVEEPEETPEAVEESDGTTEGTPDEATPEASPAVVVVEFNEGDIVAINDTGVRMRGEASVNAQPIDVYDTGVEFEITGESVDADNFTWYPVTLVDDDTVSGWVAVDFLDLVEVNEPADADDDEASDG